MKVYICHPPKKGWPIYNFWDKNYLAIVIAVGQINLVSFLKKHWRKGNSLVILHLKIWRKSQVMETLMEISMEAGNTWADACSHLYLNMIYINYTYKTDIEAILNDALRERLVTFKGWGLMSLTLRSFSILLLCTTRYLSVSKVHWSVRQNLSLQSKAKIIPCESTDCLQFGQWSEHSNVSCLVQANWKWRHTYILKKKTSIQSNAQVCISAYRTFWPCFSF